MQYNTKSDYQEETIKYFWVYDLTNKIKTQFGFLKFSFIFSWSLGYQTKKIEIIKYIVISSYQTSKETIIYMKMENREKGIRGGCECESERGKK